MEPQWNPATEEEAIVRVHRIGQQRQVTAIRYITPHSIEEVSTIKLSWQDWTKTKEKRFMF